MIALDREWIKYWEKLEDLESNEEEIEKEDKDAKVEVAEDLYESILEED